jgi:hypothetical protein
VSRYPSTSTSSSNSRTECCHRESKRGPTRVTMRLPTPGIALSTRLSGSEHGLGLSQAETCPSPTQAACEPGVASRLAPSPGTAPPNYPPALRHPRLPERCQPIRNSLRISDLAKW